MPRMACFFLVTLLFLAGCSRSRLDINSASQQTASSRGVSEPDWEVSCFTCADGHCLNPMVADATYFLVQLRAAEGSIGVVTADMYHNSRAREKPLPFLAGNFDLTATQVDGLRANLANMFSQANGAIVVSTETPECCGLQSMVLLIAKPRGDLPSTVSERYLLATLPGGCQYCPKVDIDMKGFSLTGADGSDRNIILQALKSVCMVFRTVGERLRNEEAGRRARWQSLVDELFEAGQDLDAGLALLNEGSEHFETDQMYRPHAKLIGRAREFLTRIVARDIWSKLSEANREDVGFVQAAAVAGLVHLGCVPVEAIWHEDFRVRLALLDTPFLEQGPYYGQEVLSEFIRVAALQDIDANLRLAAVNNIFHFHSSSQHALRAVAQLEDDENAHIVLKALCAQALLGEKAALWKLADLPDEEWQARLEARVHPTIRPLVPAECSDESRREIWKNWFIENGQRLYWNPSIRQFERE